MTDILDTLSELPAPENYTPEDRYHDFRRVFTGSEEGKRVFREILSWGKLFRPSVIGTPIDPYAMAIREGERNIALRLLVTVNKEPPKRQPKAKRVKST